MSVFIEIRKGLREVTKKGKAFAENQRTGKCFEEAGLQALISRLWSIHWTLSWPSDPQVKDVWMREEQVNAKCKWIDTQVTVPDEMKLPAECLAIARRRLPADIRVIFTTETSLQ